MTSDAQDMPQPLASYGPRLAGSFTCSMSNATLAARTDVLGPFAFVVITSAQLELNLGAVLASLLGAEPMTGVAMYTALSSATAQRAALLAAADAVLTGQDAVLFEALMAMARSVQGQRNDIVHGIWIDSPQLPDALIMTPPQAALSFGADLVSGRGDFHDLADDEKHRRSMTLVENAKVYTVKHFQQLARDIERVSGYMEAFAATATNAQARQRLFDEPAIQEWVHRKSKDQKKTP